MHLSELQKPSLFKVRFAAICRIVVFVLAGFSLTSTATARFFDTVVIDAGHGGSNRGARKNGLVEKHLALSVAKYLERELKRRFRVVMTRRGEYFVSLGARADIANQYPNAIFVSIHFNSSTNTKAFGIETLYHTSGRTLAILIQRELMDKIKTRNRGIVYRPGLSVLKKTRGPAVLVECGFISHRGEARRCRSRSYHKLLAKEIAQAIIRYRRF